MRPEMRTEGNMNIFSRNQVTKYDAEIGRKIKEAREERKMTQAELARAIYKSQGNISDYERGRLSINAVDLMLIAHALEKPIRYFFPVYVPTEGDLADYEAEVVHFLRKLDEERARKVSAILVDQAKHFAEIMLDADQRAYTQEIAEHLAKRKKK